MDSQADSSPDNTGSKFIGDDFQKKIKEDYYGDKAKPTTVQNPQTNAIVERVQVIGNIIRTFKLE